MAFEHEREAMVTQQLAARGIRDARVLDAMRAVPRHAFVPPDLLGRLEQVQTWDEWDPDTERYPYDWRDFTEGGGS